MTLGEEYRFSADTASRLWAAVVRGRRVPPCCTDPIGRDHASALYAGTLIRDVAGVRDNGEHLPTEGVAAGMLMRWRRAGHPQFSLTASAAAAFVLTDTAGIRWADVKLPFDDFVILMPSPSPIGFVTLSNEERPVQAIQVSRVLRPTVSMDEVSDIMRTYQEAWLAKRTPSELRSILDQLKEVPSLWVHGASESGDGIHRLYEKHTDPLQTLGDWCDPEVDGEWNSERSRVAMSLVCRVVACLALYLDHSEGPEKRWDPSLLEKNRLRGRAVTTWDIGREIKLPKELRDAARLLGRSGSDPTPWAVQSRLLVRGHWRNQPYGKGRAERRKQWVSPYWKGPEVGAVVDKLYKIGAE